MKDEIGELCFKEGKQKKKAWKAENGMEFQLQLTNDNH